MCSLPCGLLAESATDESVASSSRCRTHTGAASLSRALQLRWELLAHRCVCWRLCEGRRRRLLCAPRQQRWCRLQRRWLQQCRLQRRPQRHPAAAPLPHGWCRPVQARPAPGPAAWLPMVAASPGLHIMLGPYFRRSLCCLRLLLSWHPGAGACASRWTAQQAIARCVQQLMRGWDCLLLVARASAGR